MRREPSSGRAALLTAALLTAALLVVSQLVVACATTSRTTSRIRPTLAVFSVHTKRFKLKPDQLGALHAHATSVMEASGAFEVVPRKKLLRKLRRRRRRSERTCLTLPCQIKIGRRVLKAGMSLATRVTKNMLGQCDVFSFLYDLGQQVTDQSGRYRAAACDVETLARAVSRVTCHIIHARRRDLAPVEEGELTIGAASSAPPRARPQRDCLAQAALLWLDHKLEALGAARPPRSTKAHQAWLRSLAERVLALGRDYDQIARYPSPLWATAATCRKGRLYEVLARKTVETVRGQVSWAVKRMGKQAVAEHQQQQRRAAEQQAAPFKQKAIQLYHDCLAKAKQRELDQEERYFVEARQSLRELGPAR
jgi:hypothetical protein